MLSEKTFNVLEENDITVYNRTEQDGEFCRKIEFISDDGEHIIGAIWYDGTDNGFIDAFRCLADNFDADEHAEMWITKSGNKGIPEDIRALIDDAENIKSKLLAIADQLKGIDKKKQYYSVAVTVSSDEEIETFNFEMEAYSFEEAVEKLHIQLDVV